MTTPLQKAIEALKCSKSTCRPIAHECHNDAIEQALEIIRQHESRTPEPRIADLEARLKAAENSCKWVWNYIDGYCVIIQPKKRNDGTEPEAALKLELDKALRACNLNQPFEG